MKHRAFTLIELLTVIANIAILSAILFPVFMSAKKAVLRYQGGDQLKKIGTAINLYAMDYDDQLFPYRVNGYYTAGCEGMICTNPDYVKEYSKDPARANDWFGYQSRDAIFMNQLLEPYVGDRRVFLSPGNQSAWVGADKTGVSTDVKEYQSYGGQNSYGVNWYLFTNPIGTTSTGGGISTSLVDRTAETVLFTDALYYNILPRDPKPLLGAPDQTYIACYGNYPQYWKNIGQSQLFRKQGFPSDSEAMALGKKRWDGQIIISRLDTSIRTVKYEALINNLTDRPEGSSWDPYKMGVGSCN